MHSQILVLIGQIPCFVVSHNLKSSLWSRSTSGVSAKWMLACTKYFINFSPPRPDETTS